MPKIKIELNFGLVLAELNAMSKHKQYVIAIGFIFVGQLFLASLFILSSDGSAMQKRRISLLEKQSQSLKAQLSQGRKIASLPDPSTAQAMPSDLKFDLSDLYFSQIEKFKKEKNKQAALDLISKIHETTVIKENKARAEFEKINLICTQKLEIECMKEIDSIVTHYPQSNWTAKSLLLLSHFYYKQNRISESKSLIQVIQTEFKSYNDLNYDIQKLASQSL